MTRDDRDRTDMGDDTPRDASVDVSRPLDFSALRAADGGATNDRWEALARRIEAAAAPELTRRAGRARLAASRQAGGPPDVLLAIARSTRPALLALAASAVLAFALSRATAASSSSSAASASEPSIGQVAEVSVARALRVDEPAASWILQQRAPNAEDLARAIDPEGAQ